MANTPSTMLPLGTPAPDFAVQEVGGALVRRADFVGKPLLVAFICNHCPFVKHIAPELAKLARDYRGKGVAVVGISSNDTVKYPADGLEAMRAEKAARGYVFPYCLDETQAAAKAFTAACTPDLFLFDREHRLFYRGQFDDSRPGAGAPTGADLRAALDACLAKAPPPATQKPSIGCNIKWKPGNEPAYFQAPPPKPR
jgi:thiol-disulfide isomerase/thioredoxin